MPPDAAPSAPPPPDAFDDELFDDPARERREHQPGPPRVSWPPPGLERLQGDVWGVTARLCAAGVLFTLPLLLAATVHQEFWSLGLFGDVSWVLAAAGLTGLAILANGLVGLVRLLRRSARAADGGYRMATVMAVLADRQRDAGFLLQGARAYSELPRRRRARILRARLGVAVLAFGASLWLAAGFAAGVLLAGRDVLGPSGLVWWTLGPPGAAAVVAAMLHLWQRVHVWWARRKWFGQPWRRDLEESRIQAWHDDLARCEGAVPLRTGTRRGGMALRSGAGIAVLGGLGVALVGLVLVGMTAIGPILADFSLLHGLERSVMGLARGTALSEHRLPADPEITPMMAGEAFLSLHDVGFTNRSRSPVEKAPPRTYAEPFFTREERDGDNPTGLALTAWARELVPRLGDGLEPEVVDYLEAVGSHPALAELRTVARAGSLDDRGARLVTPLPADMSLFSLPIGRNGSVGDAIYAQIGGAVAAAARGREAEAETRLQEVVSAGMVLYEEGSLPQSLGGQLIALRGAEALIALYEATGRPVEARVLRGEIEAAERVIEIVQVRSAMNLPDAEVLRQAPDRVVQTGTPGWIRWSFFAMVNGLGPCLNLNRGIFGTDESHDRWLAEAREALVRYPVDEEIYALSREGAFGQMGLTEPGLSGRLVALVLGDAEAGGCPGALVEVL